MHLEKVYINNYGKCKTKLNAKQQRAKQEHEAWLKKRGLHPDQLKNKPKITYQREVAYTRSPDLPSVSNGVGTGYKKDENTYTGGNLLGIATMHKSNMVPVFRKEDAIAISQMRR